MFNFKCMHTNISSYYRHCHHFDTRIIIPELCSSALLTLYKAIQGVVYDFVFNAENTLHWTARNTTLQLYTVYIFLKCGRISSILCFPWKCTFYIRLLDQSHRPQNITGTRFISNTKFTENGQWKKKNWQWGCCRALFRI